MFKKLIFLVFTVFVVSCSKNNDTPDDISLEGDWVLTNVICFCGFGQDYDFSGNTISFDTRANKITVQNTGEFDFLAEPGTYAYSGSGNQITLNDRSYVFEIEEETTLRLIFADEPLIADDEVTFTYRKN
ncbi:hypothetical protein [Costertonia aggregata]|uniref:Lipocalin family protein n=1 Tax=Costertonia aggregata TaxID=343403 RepID=A0A7H9AQG9_9FLAO|nr:hypothetical protein [Costertonia aggregata]QLG45690.1 hypothetical protein HYG79_10135 [Costertonia aggregata]